MNLSEKKLQELKDKKISINELSYDYFVKFSEKRDIEGEIVSTTASRSLESFENILRLLNNNICSFKDILDKYKNTLDRTYEPCLYVLLQYNEELFEKLFKNNKLTKDDLRYLLNKIDNCEELLWLCVNTSLIKYILNEFLLDTETVDRFNTMIENVSYWRKDKNIHNIFEFIEWNAIDDYGEIDKEILKLNEINRYIYSFNLNKINFDKEQKLELAEILINSENSRNTLKQILDNNLEDTYDFKTLKSLLTKDDNKKKIKINL